MNSYLTLSKWWTSSSGKERKEKKDRKKRKRKKKVVQGKVWFQWDRREQTLFRISWPLKHEGSLKKDMKIANQQVGGCPR